MDNTVLIDNSRDRGTMLVQLGVSAVVALIAIVAYLYSATMGVNYARERDNVGNTYCIYWTPPMANFENSFVDQNNETGCPRFAQPAQMANQQSSEPATPENSAMTTPPKDG